MLSVTLVSNGHGEDVIGAQLAAAFLRHHPNLSLSAYPTVGAGSAYEAVNVPILGARQVMPSGGLLFHSLELFVQDMRAGFIPMTLRQYRELGRLKADIVLVVGDAYGLLLGSRIQTPNLFYLQSLVSAYHHKGRERRRLNRYFMERISLPERYLMARAQRIYVRDEATAVMLRKQGTQHVSALGNPVLDALDGTVLMAHQSRPLLALLPGSRAYARDALEQMLNAFRYLPFGTGLVAWAGGALPELAGWQALDAAAQGVPERGLRQVLQQGEKEVFIYEGRFADILQTAQLVLGTAGTANEQAAALGKPVVSFPVAPLYSQTFLSNQKRLLAEALTVVPAEPKAIAEALWQLYTDRARFNQAVRVGRLRMGPAGGSDAIVKDVLARAS